MSDWVSINTAVLPTHGNIVQVRLTKENKQKRVVVGYFNKHYWEIMYGIAWVPADTLGLTVESWKEIEP